MATIRAMTVFSTHGAAGQNGVMAAITRASQATGVDFAYLVKTAQRESALNPRAKAPTSSAAGLFQFVEQTWLGTIKAHGARHGYGSYASQIVRGGDGRYYVPDARARQQVLGLRYDPEAASVMAAEMTAGHAAYLKGRTGRQPNAGELYAAHFLGPAGAATLIRATQTSPNASAAALFPQAAGANRSIFYRNGQPVTVTALMANLSSKAGGAVDIIPPSTDADPYKGMLMARLDGVRSDSMLLNLAFGNGAGEQSLLFATQLMGAFGPETDEGDQGGFV